MSGRRLFLEFLQSDSKSIIEVNWFQQLISQQNTENRPNVSHQTYTAIAMSRVGTRGSWCGEERWFSAGRRL